MDWEGLQLLLKAPRKKYIKKLLEFAITLAPVRYSAPPLLDTPISQQLPADLQLTPEETHRLIAALIALTNYAREVECE